MITLEKVQETVAAELRRDYGCAPVLRQLKDLVILGLCEEAGEVAGLRKRNLRHNARDIGRGGPEEYMDELGDVLWYLAACCEVFDISLEKVWEHNRKKLEERYGGTECAGQCKLPESLYPW